MLLPLRAPAMTAPDLACAAAYVALAALILLQARRSRSGRLLALASGATACWTLVEAIAGPPWGALAQTGGPWAGWSSAAAPWAGARWVGVSAGLDLLQILAWYGFCLHLYRRAAAPAGPARLFTLIGLAAAIAAGALTALGRAGLGGTLDLLSPTILLRLGLAIAQLLLLENYWRGHPADRRSSISLACIALGTLAAYDAVVCADAVLMRAASPTLLAGRPLVALLVTPLLALAAARNRTWQVDIHVSRTAALHTATLVVSGVFLLALAAVGELARTYAPVFGVGWGSLAEVCLVCAGVITLALVLTSAAARATLRRGVIDHFFTHRYDYRREWQRCIDTLTTGTAPLQERVIRALAAAVDSPAGQLFLRQPGQAGFSWAGTWNAEPCDTPPLTEWQLTALASGDRPLALAPGPAAAAGWQPWLAVPLRDPAGAGDAAPPAGMLGIIALGRPRVAFRIDAEVIDLLRVLAHEVAIHLAQQRATEALLQTRDLREYGERFAFVAHDIKNVSSQLSLLLSNAETHLADPDFQQDMLATVRASIGRIGGLIRRLEPARAPAAPSLLDPAPLLAAVLAARPACGTTELALEIDPSAAAARIMMEPAAFQTAVGHLLDNAVNAIEAVGGGGVVRLALRGTPTRVMVDIVDDGPGMTPDFVRDQLFQPFASGTPGGTGLGAFQARELLRAAGGELSVHSRPGAGTTMRLLLPRCAGPSGAPAGDRLDPAAAEPTRDRPLAAAGA